MKLNLLSLILSILVLTAVSSCYNQDDIVISVTDSDDTYEFFAKYDKKKTRDIQDYINDQIAPTHISADEDFKVTTTLDDKTEFELEESSGRVRIKLDKGDNSVSSYHRIKKMCEGIKKELGKK